MRRTAVLGLALSLGLTACPKPPPASQPVGAQVVKAPAPEAKVSYPEDPAPGFSLEASAAGGVYQGAVGALWTADHEAGLLLAVEPKSGKLLGKAPTWPRPHDVLVARDGRRVWVSAVGVEDDLGEGGEGGAGAAGGAKGDDNGEVWVYDTKNLEVVAKLRPGRYPGHLAMRPDGRYVFASLAGANAVAVIDAASLSVLGTLPVGEQPRGLAVTPDGGRLVVANSKSSTISVIALSTLKREAEIPVGARPTQVAISPEGDLAYIISADEGKLQAFDLNSREKAWEAKVGLAPGHIVVSQESGKIYLSDSYEGTLWVVDPKTRKEERTVPAGNGAHGVALSPDSKVVYVTNGIDGTISEIGIEGAVLGSDQVEGRLRGIGAGPSPEQPKIAAVETPKTAPVKKPPTVDEARARYGRSVFKKNCDACHPSGKERVGPQIKNKGLSRRRIINQVRNGSDIMPAFDEGILTPSDLEAIIAYLGVG